MSSAVQLGSFVKLVICKGLRRGAKAADNGAKCRGDNQKRKDVGHGSRFGVINAGLSAAPAGRVGLSLVLNGNKVISNSAAVGVSSGLRRWHPSSLPVDFVVVVLLEGTGSHGSRCGVDCQIGGGSGGPRKSKLIHDAH